MDKGYVKDKFDSVIDKYGYYAIYARRDRDFRCSCYDEVSRESSLDCDLCLQTGYKIDLELIRVRRRIVTVVETNVGLRLNYEGGVNSPKAFLYYIQSDIKPKEGDIILEVDWDEEGKPIRVNEKYIISVSESMKDINGDIAFYQVYSKFKEKGDYDDKTIHRNNI